MISPELITKICQTHNIKISEHERFTIGFGNYVFKIKTYKETYVLRISENSYDNTINILNALTAVGINVSHPLFYGSIDNYNYMICNYIEGDEIGIIYPKLTDKEKRDIAKEVIAIQNKVSKIASKESCNILEWVQYILNRARNRIAENKYFDVKLIVQVEKLIPKVQDYFDIITPVVYLDDISTKNLIIKDGQVAGVIDLDWLGFGDPLTFIALTNIALLDMEYDTKYVEYLLLEKGATQKDYSAFLFYSLLYCVDFMGERGAVFNGKKVSVSPEIINKLNGIFEDLLNKFLMSIK